MQIHIATKALDLDYQSILYSGAYTDCHKALDYTDCHKALDYTDCHKALDYTDCHKALDSWAYTDCATKH